MKRQWEIEELIEQFTLMPSELALLPDEITNATPLVVQKTPGTLMDKGFSITQ